jgi:hypothetical protein
MAQNLSESFISWMFLEDMVRPQIGVDSDLTRNMRMLPKKKRAPYHPRYVSVPEVLIVLLQI